MNRRDTVLALLALGAAGGAPTSLAQQPGKVWRVGFLAYNRRPAALESHPFFGAFLQGMRELGYAEGRNLAIEWRFADYHVERLAGFAAEFVRLKVDAIVCATTVSIRAAQKATATIPIVMLTSYDPVGDGFVKSLSRPGANITGRTNIAVEIGPKLLEMLHAIVPKLARLAVLVNPDNSGMTAALRHIQDAARKTDTTILPLEARTPQEIDNAFAQAARAKADGLIVSRDVFFNNQAREMAALAAKHRLPTAATFSEFPEAGGLMSYGENRSESPRRAAIYLDKIFKGAKPSDLPVEQPTHFELVINASIAKALGLKIPQSVLLRTDRVVG